MFDEEMNSVFAEFVLEGFRVVTLVSDLRAVSLHGGAMNIGDVEHLDIDKSSDFQRADAIVRTLNAVAARLIAVETSCIDGSVVRAFLRRNADKRTPVGYRNRFKPVVEDQVVGQPRQADFREDVWHFAEEIDDLMIGFPEFDPQSMERKHRLFDEPDDPERGGGFVGVGVRFLTFVNRFLGEEADFRSHTNSLFAFYHDNRIRAAPSAILQSKWNNIAEDAQTTLARLYRTIDTRYSFT